MQQSRLARWAMFVLFAIPTLAWCDTTEVTITVEKKPDISQKPPFAGPRPGVDVAILLDTSNSMDGLINQARSQLWTIVQQFAQAKKSGQTPILRVALFEYGNTRLPATEGYLRQVVPLVSDLDQLSAALFALSTSGGDEYCGQVIDQALTRLDWSAEPGAYQAIFIAGNEPFTQGSVAYQQACRRAIEQGIVVNTIHCGNRAAGIDGQWQAAALLAEGEFFNIDQDRAVPHIKCPQDKIILQLNAELNKTYLWYGDRDLREQAAENQVAQDSNAASVGPSAAVGRALVKAGPAYRNMARCLVDAFQADPQTLSQVPEADLPEVLQPLTLDERQAYLQELAAQRTEVQSKIAAAAAQRETYLAEQRKLQAQQQGPVTLGEAVVSAIAKQLDAAGFETQNP